MVRPSSRARVQLAIRWIRCSAAFAASAATNGPSRVTRHPARVGAVVVPGDVVAELRQHHDPGAAGDGPVGHPQAGGEVGVDVLGDAELDGGDAHCGHFVLLYLLRYLDYSDTPIPRTIGASPMSDVQGAESTKSPQHVQVEAFAGRPPTTVDLGRIAPFGWWPADRGGPGGLHRPGRVQPGRRRAARHPGPLRLRRHDGRGDPDRGGGRGRRPAAPGGSAGRHRTAYVDHRPGRRHLGRLLRAQRPGHDVRTLLHHPDPARRRGPALQPAGLQPARRLLPGPGPGQGLRPGAGGLLHGPPRRRRRRRRTRRGGRLALGVLHRRGPRRAGGDPGLHRPGAAARPRRPDRPDARRHPGRRRTPRPRSRTATRWCARRASCSTSGRCAA